MDRKTFGPSVTETSFCLRRLDLETCSVITETSSTVKLLPSQPSPQEPIAVSPVPTGPLSALSAPGIIPGPHSANTAEPTPIFLVHTSPVYALTPLPMPRPPITVGSHVVAPNSLGIYTVNSKTLTPGGPAVNIDKTPIHIKPPTKGVLVGSITEPKPHPNQEEVRLAILPIGSQTHIANPNGKFYIAGQKLSPGSPPIQVSGVLISVGTEHQVVIGGKTFPMPTAQPTPQAALRFGPQTVNPNAEGNYIIDGQTLTPGHAITVSGTRIALNAAGSEAIVSNSVHSLGPDPRMVAPVTVDNHVLTPVGHGSYVVDGQTITPGTGDITVSDTRIAMPSPRLVAAIGSSIQTLPSVPMHQDAITVGGETFSPNKDGTYVIAGQTLVPGGSTIVVSGTPVALAPDGSSAIVGSSVENLQADPTPMPAITIGSQTILPKNQGTYLIGGQTLAPGGPPITVSGTRVSLAADGSEAVIGSSTEMLTPASAAFPPITVDGQTITPNNGGTYVVDGQTASPGGSAITVDGTPVSVFSHPSALVIGGSTEYLGPMTTAPLVLPPVTLGGQVFSTNAQGAYVINGQTITPGANGAGPINISLLSGFMTVTASPEGASMDNDDPILTIGGQRVTANPTGFAIDSIHVSPGGPEVTVSKTPVSLGSGSSPTLLVGNETIVLLEPTATSPPEPPPAVEALPSTAKHAGAARVMGRGEDVGARRQVVRSVVMVLAMQTMAITVVVEMVQEILLAVLTMT